MSEVFTINNTLAYYNNKCFGCISKLVYSVVREMAPIYTVNQEPPPTKRSIAGSISFALLDFSGVPYDLIPPFDIFAETYEFPDYYNKVKLFGGVELLGSGYGAVKEDLMVGKAYTFICKYIDV